MRTFGPGPRVATAINAHVGNAFWWVSVVVYLGSTIGIAVLAAWTQRALSGRRKRAHHWQGWLGRAMGAAWIIVFAVNTAVRFWYLRH